MRVTNPVRSPAAIISALTTFPDELARAIFSDHGRASLMQPASDGGWGVVEIIPHLRDWEEIYLDRARKIIAETRPHLPGFDDTLWAIERDYRGQDPKATFEAFRALRLKTVELLTSLPPEAWLRTGEHGYYGEITLAWMADHMCGHDQEHLQQARDAIAG